MRATGVDFCACSSFKWLMGDFGLGFLYVREDLLERIVRRSQYGYYMASSMATHFLPFDPPGPDPLTFELGKDATGHFEIGSQANGAWASLSASLPYVRRVGVENIEAYRQPMLRKLQKEMPRLGFQPLTPADSKSPLVTFAMKDAGPVEERLKRARRPRTNRGGQFHPAVAVGVQRHGRHRPAARRARRVTGAIEIFEPSAFVGRTPRRPS